MAAVLFILFAGSFISALNFESRFGLIYYGYTGESRYTSSPVKSFMGISIPFKLNSRIDFRPGLELFYFDYVWDQTEGRAVPAAIETADRICVFHFLLDPAFTVNFNPAEYIFLGVGGGPSFLLRLPMFASDGGDVYRDELVSYLYSSGRFVYTAAGGFFRWQFSENSSLNLRLWTHLPVFHFWDGSDQPFLDQMLIEAGAGFLFSFNFSAFLYKIRHFHFFTQSLMFGNQKGCHSRCHGIYNNTETDKNRYYRGQYKVSLFKSLAVKSAHG